VENEKYTLQNLDYGEKNEKRGKWDTNTVRPGIWRKKKKTAIVRK